MPKSHIYKDKNNNPPQKGETIDVKIIQVKLSDDFNKLSIYASHKILEELEEK